MSFNSLPDLLVPDRFEGLRNKARNHLSSIVVPVEVGLRRIDEIYRDMRAAGRGAFLLFRGNPGVGKSTFLHTVNIFRENVETISIPSGDSVRNRLHALPSSHSDLEILILEEREALRDITTKELESDLHAINGFIRSPRGERCLVVWPCNTDDLQERLIEQARQVGGDALVGTGDPAFQFKGPDKAQFKSIAENTIAVLNEGATISDLGVSAEELDEIVLRANTVGIMLGRMRESMARKRGEVNALLEKEKCRLWIVVSAGNEPENDVDALTRGQYSAIDIERLLASTDANIIQEFKTHKDRMGILGTVLDAKIFYLPMLAALDIARTYKDQALLRKMQDANLAHAATGSTKALERLGNTTFAKAFGAHAQGPRSPGKKPGSNTKESFEKLVGIARTSDATINRAVAEALKNGCYINSYVLEDDLGSGMTRRTDIKCIADNATVRVEMMWRSRTSRAEIANYVLTKIYNYGRAIGFLS